jgi:hypothetical protein
MPCKSDYMNQTDKEKESVTVLNLLKELKVNTGIYDKYYGRIETIDEDTAELCYICQSIDVTKKSLELQYWWIGHQIADKKRIEKEIKENKVVVLLSNGKRLIITAIDNKKAKDIYDALNFYPSEGVSNNSKELDVYFELEVI